MAMAMVIICWSSALAINGITDEKARW